MRSHSSVATRGRGRLLAHALVLSAIAISAKARADDAKEAGPRPRVEGTSSVVPDVSDPLLTPPPQPTRKLGSFQEAKDRIEHRSPDLALARADLERAEGVYRQAFAGVLPTVNGTASITARPLQPTLIPGVSPPGYTYLGQIVATERVVAPATWKLIGANGRDVDRAKLSVEDARRRVYGGLAETVLGVVVAERAASLARDGLRAALQTHALWTRRRALGVGTDLDLARLAQDVATARLHALERSETLLRAREALGLALGSDEPWGVETRVDSESVEAAVRKACTPVDGPDARPDVAAAAVAREVSERLVERTRLEFVPTVDLVTSVGVQPSSFTSTEPAANVQFGGVLSWSIWDGGARYGTLRSARANVDAATARHDRARREATLQVSQTARSVAIAKQALGAAVEARDRAEDTDRLVRAALAAGSGSTLDLVQAQQGLRRAETEVALREFQLVRARVEEFLVSSRCSP